MKLCLCSFVCTRDLTQVPPLVLLDFNELLLQVGDFLDICSHPCAGLSHQHFVSPTLTCWVCVYVREGIRNTSYCLRRLMFTLCRWPLLDMGLLAVTTNEFFPGQVVVGSASTAAGFTLQLTPHTAWWKTLSPYFKVFQGFIRILLHLLPPFNIFKLLSWMIQEQPLNSIVASQLFPTVFPALLEVKFQ